MSYMKLYYLLNKDRILESKKNRYWQDKEFQEKLKESSKIRRILDNFLNLKGGGRMKGAVVRRKYGFDIILLNEENKVQDIIVVRDLEYFSDLSSFEKKYLKQKQIEEVANEQD